MKAYTITLTFNSEDDRDEGMEHLKESTQTMDESMFDELDFEIEKGEKEN